MPPSPQQQAYPTFAPPAQQPQAQQHPVDPLNPTDLGAALSTLNLNQYDPQWYMDSASSTCFLNRIIQLLSSEFAMTDLGALHHFLGITVQRTNSGLFLSQSQYDRDILHRANMTTCKPCATSVDTSSKLSANDGSLLPDGSAYRSLAGALQYLTFTRPDISYVVQQVCLFMHAPREPHFAFMKWSLRYIQDVFEKPEKTQINTCNEKMVSHSGNRSVSALAGGFGCAAEGASVDWGAAMVSIGQGRGDSGRGSTT
ncbi:uncharacterized mitochondrial protein AtMg00810-like [Helianthus annuus]|uniref:uncharacterized mitochondrial protein AtMg00810-like n=1 Tax=Helianthus annuus TaxID=4232 RepID=UPI000B900C18|nr:uncharacterized mitochondrial protein AtMg00810-like [Helianthus annuus]